MAYRTLTLIAAASLAALPAAAAAQTAPMKGEFRLSDQEIATVLREAEARPQTPQTPQIANDRTDAPSPPPVHGEIGVGIGTGGYRSFYGGFGFGDEQSGGAAWVDMDWYVQRNRDYQAIAH